MKKVLLSAIVASIAIISCQDNSPKTVSDIICDATINTLSVISPDGDSLYFGTMGADKSQVNGILIGDTAIVGSWVQPIPGIGGTQGIKIDANGVANSINMYTLTYNRWSRNGDTLTFTGQSIGNGQTIDFTEVYTIDKLNTDSLVISSKGMGSQRFSRQVTE